MQDVYQKLYDILIFFSINVTECDMLAYRINTCLYALPDYPLYYKEIFLIAVIVCFFLECVSKVINT